MPDKIVEDVSKETNDPKKTMVTDAKAMENRKKENAFYKKASKDKIGKCPGCNIFYYYISRGGSNKGQSLASAFLTACPKYINAAVEARAMMIVNNKACAVCT